MIKLFYSPGSVSPASHIALEEAGAAYEAIKVDTAAGDQRKPDADMRRQAPQTMAACFQLIEEELLAGPFVLGDAFSVCDAYLFAVARWLEGDGVDIARFPKVQAHAPRVGARPAVRKVLAETAA